jgi:hypothetical protein
LILIFGSFSARRAEKEPEDNINLGNFASFGRAPEGALFYGSSAMWGIDIFPLRV